jgi:hypothetical protein
MISRQFDAAEATRRFGMVGADAVDDDGRRLEYEETEHLEIAHIIPYALVSSNGPFVPLVRWSFLSLRQVLNAGFSRASQR